MSQCFSSKQGLIVVPVELTGPARSAVLRMALDTGATSTIANTALLVALGYDPALESERVQVTTGSGIEFAPAITVRSISTIGHTRIEFRVLALTLPAISGIDGLLGLDFLRELRLSIDFRIGQNELV